MNLILTVAACVWTFFCIGSGMLCEEHRDNPSRRARDTITLGVVYLIQISLITGVAFT